MKKHCLITLFILSCFTSSYSQNIKPYFTIAPDIILGYVNINQRKDLIDLYEAKQNAAIKNQLGGTTQVDTMSYDFIKIKLSTLTDIEIKLIQNESDTTGIIVVNKTIQGQYPESNLAFYTTSWNTIIPETLFEAPVWTDFIRKDTPEAIRYELMHELAYRNISYELIPQTNQIKVIPSFLNSFSKEAIEKWNSYFDDTPLIYSWNEGRYVK